MLDLEVAFQVERGGGTCFFNRSSSSLFSSSSSSMSSPFLFLLVLLLASIGVEQSKHIQEMTHNTTSLVNFCYIKKVSLALTVPVLIGF